jgi:hypothetical protein
MVHEWSAEGVYTNPLLFLKDTAVRSSEGILYKTIMMTWQHVRMVLMKMEYQSDEG